MDNPFSEDPQPNPYGSPQFPLQQPMYGPPPDEPNNSLAMTSMILGIASLALLPAGCCCGLVLVVNAGLAIAGGITGYIASGQAKRGEATGESMALAGMITSGITLALIAAAVVFYIVIIALDISGNL